MGPETFLTSAEERELVTWVLKNAEKGIPLSKSTLCQAVKKILDNAADKRVVPFKDNYPGYKWFTSFLRRHPEVTSKNTSGGINNNTS